MSIYDKNMECLKHNRNSLYDQLLKYRQETSVTITVLTVDAKIQGKTLIIQKQEQEYYLNSCYNPKHEAEQWIKQYKFLNINTIITMFGLVNGVFVNEIIKNKGKNDVILIYEPSVEVFVHVLHNYDITNIIADKSVLITIDGINEYEFHNVLQACSNSINITNQIQCMHPNYKEVFPEKAIKFLKEIKDNYIHTKIEKNTINLFGKRYIENEFLNIKHIKNSNLLTEILLNIDTEVPAIIVAAGPSLQNNIEKLKKAKGKSYIFVVDRILDYVLDSGLVPDFIVTIDAMKPVELVTNRLNITIPLFCELNSNWEILERHKGRKIFYNMSNFVSLLYKKSGKDVMEIATGGSVATAAFAICQFCGFKRIVLVGQDLSYDGAITHAGGIMEKDDIGEQVMVEGIGGVKVRSRYDWYEFLQWYKDVIKLNPLIEVIDVKDRGALIPGTKVMRLEDVIDQYCIKEVNVDRDMNNIEPTFNELNIPFLKKYFTEGLENLSNISRKATEAITLCDKLLKDCKDTSTVYIKNKKRLIKLNQYMYQQPIYPLLDNYVSAMASDHLSRLYQLSANTKNDEEDTYKKSKIIYSIIIESVKYTRQFMEDVIKNFL